MEKHSATTVAEYLAIQSPERRKIFVALRSLIKKNLPTGYQEVLLSGMICYVVPLRVEPNTYNGQPLYYIGLAAQKHFYALYLMGVYGDPKQSAYIKKAFATAGLKLNMGKSCIRFTTIEQLPLPAIARLIRWTPMRRLIDLHQTIHRKKK
jgi:hypothetical protein